MKTLSIDIETFSPEPLAKCGVYRYCQTPEFEVLLFGYSVDSGPVRWWISPPAKSSPPMCWLR